jgi:hypothetical protein
VTDLLLLLLVRHLFAISTLHSKQIPVWSQDIQAGFKVLLLIAMLAQCIHVASNFKLLLLPKHEYIAAMGEALVPNLIFFSFPADSLLVGGLLFNPFQKKGWRYLLITLAAITMLISVIQGYRLYPLLVMLCWFFRWSKRGGVLLVVVVLSLLGQISNPLKYLVAGSLINPDFSVSEFIEYHLANPDMLFGLSGEQKAIHSNLLIGLNNVQIGMPLLELHNLLPFTNRLLGRLETTGVSRLGDIVGVDEGQGTGYNLQLFGVETLFLGLIFVVPSALLVRKFAHSMLIVMTLELFYSILRNSPEFWSGQLKILCLLIVLVYYIGMVRQGLRGVRPIKSALIGTRRLSHIALPTR